MDQFGVCHWLSCGPQTLVKPGFLRVLAWLVRVCWRPAHPATYSVRIHRGAARPDAHFGVRTRGGLRGPNSSSPSWRRRWSTWPESSSLVSRVRPLTQAVPCAGCRSHLGRRGRLHPWLCRRGRFRLYRYNHRAVVSCQARCLRALRLFLMPQPSSAWSLVSQQQRL